MLLAILLEFLGVFLGVLGELLLKISSYHLRQGD